MTVRESLAAKAIERAANWSPTFVRKLPSPERLDEMALLGSYSYSLPQSRRRIIKDSIEIVDGIRETPSAIARDYLRITYGKRPLATKRQIEMNVAQLPPPNVAHPGRFAHGFYIDIVSCYWSIMQVVGWDVDYMPGKWLAGGRPPTDYPFPEHKVGRNCLHSACTLHGIPRYDPRKLPGDPYDEVTAGNSLSNAQLPRLTYDVLNSIGYQCIKAGAIYMNNDGIIAPTPKIAATCEGIITDWGLRWAVKAQGSGEVKAAGTYRVGMEETLTFRHRQDTHPIELVYPLYYIDWLQREFAFFAAEVKEWK